MGIFDIIKGVAGPITGIIDQFVDDPEEKAKAKALLMEQQTRMMEQATEAEMARAKTVQTEIQGQSWLQRNWRPILALSFGFIIVNNYILVPYAQAFGAPVPTLEMPGGLWALLTTMIGGYTVGRSWEKRHGVEKNDIPGIAEKVLNRIGNANS